MFEISWSELGPPLASICEVWLRPRLPPNWMVAVAGTAPWLLPSSAWSRKTYVPGWSSEIQGVAEAGSRRVALLPMGELSSVHR